MDHLRSSVGKLGKRLCRGSSSGSSSESSGNSSARGGSNARDDMSVGGASTGSAAATYEVRARHSVSDASLPTGRAIRSQTAASRGVPTSSPSPAFMPRMVEEGFTLLSVEEQQHYLAVRGRFVPNFDLDETFLTSIGMWEDLRRILDNLGWVDFHLLPMDYNLDVVTEVASTMRLGTVKDGSEAVNFRVRDISHTVTMEAAAQAFSFDADTNVAHILGHRELDFFWRRLSFIEEMKRKNIRNLTIQVFH
ncbi:hypothetical protein PR202_ga03576 [Eleusine coracana subsp. coracana]|uniref:Uncharacterized protein n=1 Tax=Eleusine coracana subsp. coracana TaxID=191504 RepID=A0AAV5BPH7_ELECO|nr:hypothetical protein PR202_ga03576 [Eleusine coracana subsp. coracana]